MAGGLGDGGRRLHEGSRGGPQGPRGSSTHPHPRRHRAARTHAHPWGPRWCCGPFKDPPPLRRRHACARGPGSQEPPRAPAARCVPTLFPCAPARHPRARRGLAALWSPGPLSSRLNRPQGLTARPAPGLHVRTRRRGDFRRGAVPRNAGRLRSGALLPLVPKPQVPSLGQPPPPQMKTTHSLTDHRRKRQAGDPGSASSPLRGHACARSSWLRRALQPGASPRARRPLAIAVPESPVRPRPP